MAELTIREFRYPQDYPAVYRLWSEAGEGIHLGRSDAPVEIEKKLQRDPDLFLLAETDGQLAGAVVGGFDGRRGMMYHLAVAQSFRQQGVATQLLGELERRLKAKGCLRYYLLVTKDNLDAVRYYENHGWERLELWPYAKDVG